MSLITPPLEEADKSSLDGLPKDTHGTNDPALWYRSVIDDRGKQDSRMSQPASESNLSSRQNKDFQAASLWARNTYPLQATTETLPEYHSPVPKSITDEEHEQPPNQVSKLDQNGAMKRTLRRIPRSLRIESVGVEEASLPVQPTEIEQSTGASGTNSWTSSTYPLQSITSGATTQHLAPLPSKEELGPANTAHLGQLEENGAASKGGGSRDRRMNPVQPLTHGTRALDPSPPFSESKFGNVSKTPTYEPQKSNQPAKERRMSLQQNYPLQAPASTADLRHSLTPPPSPPEYASKVIADQVRENDQAATRSKTLRHQVYPLQAPASNANLRHALTPPASPGREGHTSKAPAHQIRENYTATMRGKASRQIYPLQSPASAANLQRSPGGGSQEEDEASTKQSRDIELATKVVKQWRRQIYPSQSPQMVAPSQRLPTPQEKAEKNHVPRSIHLPKNVRALTDADAEEHDFTGRTIVVCLDGTGDSFDNDNSNIVHLVSALKKDDARQVTYYQAGIGTYGPSGLSAGVSAAMDMAVGSSLGLHIRDAYNFLMHTYKEGDKICIFSFSRGAYTARCLAGMIHKVGLLPPRNIQQISFAYEFYANDTPEGWKQSSDFKKTFCIDVCVYFLGCFDSVASVGFIPRTLPLSSTPTKKPRYFRHAMALDERRAKFKVCRHQVKTWDEIEKVASPTNATVKSAESRLLHYLPNYKVQNDKPPPYSPQMKSEQVNHVGITDEEYGRLTGHEAPFETDVLEVWFAGAHADIGGGAVLNDERHKLAQIPLRWMIRQAFECNTGIIFNTAVLAEFGLDVHMLWPKYERLSAPAHGPPPSFLEKYDKDLPPRSIRRSKLVPINRHEKGEHFYHLKNHTDEGWTPEQVEDFYDAMSPLNDQLVQAPNWWILEAWPVQYKVFESQGKVSIRNGMNLGRYRAVEDFTPNLHWTVLQRVQHQGYRIQARTAAHTKWRIVV